jgi:hypothetical protein
MNDLHPEPAIVTTGYSLCALLDVCGHALLTLEQVPEGEYRAKIVNGMSTVMEHASRMAEELLIHAERTQKAGA